MITFQALDFLIQKLLISFYAFPVNITTIYITVNLRIKHKPKLPIVYPLVSLRNMAAKSPIL